MAKRVQRVQFSNLWFALQQASSHTRLLGETELHITRSTPTHSKHPSSPQNVGKVCKVHVHNTNINHSHTVHRANMAHTPLHPRQPKVQKNLASHVNDYAAVMGTFSLH